MRKFFIIYNGLKEDAKIVADRVSGILISKGCEAVKNETLMVEPPYLYTDPKNLPKDTECIIAIGGDGTLIRAARDTAGLDLPLIGINTGHLGFLAEIEQDELECQITKLIKDEHYIEDRIRLDLSIFDKENRNTKVSDSALNDIVLLRKSFSGILGINIYVNNQHLNSYNADGVIISTPTGSTGYSLSAGGPVIDPVSNMILITPINPHTMNSRSIVLSGDTKIDVELSERSFASGINGVVICDGESIGLLSRGLVMSITRSANSTKIARLNKTSFIKILRNKMKDE